ncbi:hypothetical protein Esti_002002 [Eimeria stiedai]
MCRKEEVCRQAKGPGFSALGKFPGSGSSSTLIPHRSCCIKMADSAAAGAPGCSSTRPEPLLSVGHEGDEAQQQQQSGTPATKASSAFPLLVFPSARKTMLPSGAAVAAVEDDGGSDTPQQQPPKDSVSCSDSADVATWEHQLHSPLGMHQQHQQQPGVHQGQICQKQQLQQQPHQQLHQQFAQQLRLQQQQPQLDIDADNEQKLLLARLELLLKEVALATGSASGVPAPQADIKQQKPPQQPRRQRQQRQRPQQQRQQPQQRALATPEEALLMLVDEPESGDWRRRPQQKQQQQVQPDQTLLKQQQQLMQWLLVGPRERQQEQQQKLQKGCNSNSALSKQLLTRRSSSMMSSSTAAATGSSISTGCRTSASSTAVGGAPSSTGTSVPFTMRRNTGGSVADASETTDVLPLLLDLAFACKPAAAATPAAAAPAAAAVVTGASATPETAPPAGSPPHSILSTRSQGHPTSNGKSRPSLSLPSLQQRMQKTKMCRFHMQGCCSKGALCVFAHDAKELRERPNLIRTRLCPLMRAASLSGVAGAAEGGVDGAAGGGMGALGSSRMGVPHCSKGDACRFAHSLEELRSTPEFFKTAVCPLHAAGGPQACPLGASCRFAHGEAELRPRPHAGPPPPPAAAAEAAGSVDRPSASEGRRAGGSWGGGWGGPKGPPPGLEMMRDKRRAKGRAPDCWSLLPQQSDACASSTADPWLQLRPEAHAVPNSATVGGSNGTSMSRDAGRMRASESAAVQWHKLLQKQRKQQQQKQQKQQQQLQRETSKEPWAMTGQKGDVDCGSRSSSSSSSSCHCSGGASPGDLLIDSQEAVQRWLLHALQQQQQQALHASAAEALADQLCDTSLSQGCRSGGYGGSSAALPSTSAAGAAVFLEPVSRVVGERGRASTEEQQEAAALSITAALAAACGAVQQNKEQAPFLDTAAHPFLVAADVPDSCSSSTNNSSSSSSSIDLQQLGGVVTDFASESSTVCPFAATTASTQSNREVK